MKSKKKEKKRYSFSLKLDDLFKQPLKEKAEKNRRTINEEINIAVENYLKSSV